MSLIEGYFRGKGLAQDAKDSEFRSERAGILAKQSDEMYADAANQRDQNSRLRGIQQPRLEAEAQAATDEAPEDIDARKREKRLEQKIARISAPSRSRAAIAGAEMNADTAEMGAYAAKEDKAYAVSPEGIKARQDQRATHGINAEQGLATAEEEREAWGSTPEVEKRARIRRMEQKIGAMGEKAYDAYLKWVDMADEATKAANRVEKEGTPNAITEYYATIDDKHDVEFVENKDGTLTANFYKEGTKEPSETMKPRVYSSVMDLADEFRENMTNPSYLEKAGGAQQQRDPAWDDLGKDPKYRRAQQMAQLMSKMPEWQGIQVERIMFEAIQMVEGYDKVGAGRQETIAKMVMDLLKPGAMGMPAQIDWHQMPGKTDAEKMENAQRAATEMANKVFEAAAPYTTNPYGAPGQEGGIMPPSASGSNSYVSPEVIEEIKRQNGIGAGNSAAGI